MIRLYLRLLQCRLFGHDEPFSEISADTARQLGLSWRYRCPRCGRRVA